MAKEVAEEFDGWKPMTEDFQSLSFNSYGSGQTAGHLPYKLLTPFRGHKRSERPTLKLFIEGFPSSLTETGLRSFLKGIGVKSSAVKIIHSKNHMNRVFGFVDFVSTKWAQNCIQLIKSQNIYKLFVCFTSNEREIEEKEDIIDEEFNRFVDQVIQQHIQIPDS